MGNFTTLQFQKMKSDHSNPNLHSEMFLLLLVDNTDQHAGVALHVAGGGGRL